MSQPIKPLLSKISHRLFIQLVDLGFTAEGPIESVIAEDGIDFVVEVRVRPKPKPKEGGAGPAKRGKRGLVRECVMEAVKKEGSPLTYVRLAELAGYSDSDWFHRRVKDLMDAGLLDLDNDGRIVRKG